LSGQREAFLCSIGIHLVVCMLAFGVLQETTPERKPLIIDFSLVDQPATAQAAQSPCGTEAVPDAVGEPDPLPAKTDEDIAPVEDPGEPTPQVQQTVTENQVAIPAPEPKRRSRKAKDKTATRLSGPKKTLPSNPVGTSTSCVNPETAGSGAGMPGSGGGNEPAGSMSPSEQGGRGERPETAYLKAHLVGIRNTIIRKLSYPPAARKNGWAGTVKVSFVVNEDGSVKNVKIHVSSGFEMLDHNAVETIKRCSPFPKPPCMVEIIMPIKYRLDE
jgi:TonB family protein